MVNMLIGDTRSLKLIGDIGQAVTGATWSISDPTVAKISSADPPQLTALGQGTTTLTGTFNGLTAAMTINVLLGTALPAGSALWSFDPLPGNTITEMVPGNPVNSGDPDILVVEAPQTLRAFSKDGQQLWAVSLGARSTSATNIALPSTLEKQNLSLQSHSVTNPGDAAQAITSIPASEQDLLRKHGAFDSLDLLLRQQHFIEQQRQRAFPRNVPAISGRSALSLAVPSVNVGSSDVTTLLIKAVADNSGGVINLVGTFSGCCAITQTSFIKIDSSTQQQVWRQDFTGAVDVDFAIGADSTVYSSQLVFPPVSNPFAAAFGTASSSNIFALDPDTGHQIFSVSLPPGHFKLTDAERNSTAVVLADVDLAAQPGPLSILPDGSINAMVYTNHLEEDFQNLFLFSGFERGVSDHKTLQLLTIQPDGSSIFRPVQQFDFDATSCPAAGCNDPGAGYIPNEVIPDGQGGVLATWAGNDTQLGITNSSAALVRHFDNTGGMLDYAVPFASRSWFRVGGNNPQGLVLGGSNTAFGSDGQSIVAFDVNTGMQLWSFEPSGFQGVALLGATTQPGLAAVQLADFQGEFDASPNALLSFDSAGAVNPITFAASTANVTYFDANTLLAITSSVGEMVSAPAPSIFNSTLNLSEVPKNVLNTATFDPIVWSEPMADRPGRRASPPPTITFDKQIVKAGISLIGQDVRGTIRAAIKPKSRAPEITFSSTNSTRATVSEEGRVDNGDSLVVTLRITGISQTPAGVPQGDAYVQALIHGKRIGPRIPALVVVPISQAHQVGPLRFENSAKVDSLLDGTPVTELRTDANTTVTITIFDQFNQKLDSVYNGNAVVTEQFSNTSESGFPLPGSPTLPTVETVITEPDSSLQDGIKLDGIQINAGTLIGNILTATQIDQWQNGVLLIANADGAKSNNVFSLRKLHPIATGAQTVRVHGYPVIPTFIRTQEVQPLNTPPIPFTAKDVAQ
jgi:outer membrane protein assembly factor BamB